MLKNRRIAASVGFWMVVVAIAPLLIMTFQGYHCARQAVLELTSGQLVTIVEAKQARIDDWLGERLLEIQSLAAFADLQSPGGIPLQTLFNQAQTNNPAYESITLYSSDWTRLADSGQHMHDDELLLLDEFKTTLSTGQGVAISKPHIHDDGMIGIHIGIPVAGERQYIVAVLDLSGTLYPILESTLGQTDTTRSYIVACDGLFLSPPADGVRPLQTRIELPEELTHGNHTAVYRDFQGKSVVGASVTLKDLGWMLVSETPTQEAFAWLSLLRGRAMKTGLFTLVLVVLLAVQSARRISQPLRHMADVAHRISDGHYTTRMKHFPGREHTEVADAFNRMLDELDHAQARLAQSAALSAIGELSASIVHEMRNPLSAIKMNLEILKQATQDDPILRELGDIAAEQVLRLEAMLDDLLQYGRKVEIRKAEVPVADFVQEVEACIRREEGQNIAFAFRNDGEIKTLAIDREQMLRAVSNLVDNAVQASPSGGTVTLTLHRTPSQALKIEVTDQGPGISERVGQKLFEPFFTTRKTGTGLGLANVKKIVELHGGRIDVRNTKPGCIFTITLPNEGEPI